MGGLQKQIHVPYAIWVRSYCKHEMHFENGQLRELGGKGPSAALCAKPPLGTRMLPRILTGTPCSGGGDANDAGALCHYICEKRS